MDCTNKYHPLKLTARIFPKNGPKYNRKARKFPFATYRGKLNVGGVMIFQFHYIGQIDVLLMHPV